MVRSYLLSLLATKFGPTDFEAFVRAHPSAWIVWEPGHWMPVPQGLLASQTATQSPRRQVRRAAPTSALAMELTLSAHKPHLTIGRDPTCDLPINDATLSRVHLQLSKEAKGWSVFDPGSMNGTHLNGRPLSPRALAPLSDSAEIDAGDVLLTFHEPRGLFSRLHHP